MLIIRTRLQPSPIHGLGVFAGEPIAAGQVVSRFLPPFDIQFSAALFAVLQPAEADYLRHYAYRSQYSGLYILTGDHDRFMNHSDTPNIDMNPDGSLTCVALQPVREGEELTTDYRTFDADWKAKLPHLCNS